MKEETNSEEAPLLHMLPIIQRLVQISDGHKKYGLTKSQIPVLIALSYKKSMTMSEIAKYMDSSKEQATRAIAAMCDSGIVERFESPENRTHVYIRFTEQGKTLMREISENYRREISARLENSLTEEERLTLCSSVETAVTLLRKVK